MNHAFLISPTQPNAERSHAGPRALASRQRGLPVLAGLTGSVICYLTS